MSIRIFFILLFYLAFSLKGETAVWSVDNLEMVHLKDARRYVCDPDGYLNRTEIDRIDVLLQHLEEDKGVESIVVIAEHLKGNDAFQFGIDLSRKYGIGNKVANTGLILIVSPGDRSYYILTGQGLEGTLPDVVCKRIERQVMLPLLKREQWGEAIYETVRALDKIIRGDQTIIKELEKEDAIPKWVLLTCLLSLFILLALFINAIQPRCPKCQKKRLQLLTQKPVLTPKGIRLQLTYICSNCNCTITKLQEPSSMRSDNFMSGLLLGSFLGIGRRSNGLSGGNFGGGSFGGGGAGGRF